MEYRYQNAFCPDQVNITVASVSSGRCAHLSVFTDSPKVTADGIHHLGRLRSRNCHQLREVTLGRNNSWPEMTITAEAVTGSVRQGCDIELFGHDVTGREMAPTADCNNVKCRRRVLLTKTMKYLLIVK